MKDSQHSGTFKRANEASKKPPGFAIGTTTNAKKNDQKSKADNAGLNTSLIDTAKNFLKQSSKMFGFGSFF